MHNKYCHYCPFQLQYVSTPQHSSNGHGFYVVKCHMSWLDFTYHISLFLFPVWLVVGAFLVSYQLLIGANCLTMTQSAILLVNLLNLVNGASNIFLC